MQITPTTNVVFVIPHDLQGFFETNILQDTLVYDAKGVARGTLSENGVKLFTSHTTLSLFEAAKVDALEQGSVQPRSGWKYWHIRKKNELISLYTIRKTVQVRLNGYIESILASSLQS